MFLKKLSSAIPSPEQIELARKYQATIEALQENTPEPQRFILTTGGEIISLAEWQKEYDLSFNNVGKYFTLDEEKLQGSFLLAEPLIRLLDDFRKTLDKPVSLTSAFRTVEKQRSLIAGGNKGAVSVSPHCGGFAADIACKSSSDVYKKVETLQKLGIAQKLELRIGFKQYLSKGSTFVHVDVCAEYFGTNKPFEFLKTAFPFWDKKGTW